MRKKKDGHSQVTESQDLFTGILHSKKKHTSDIEFPVNDRRGSRVALKSELKKSTTLRARGRLISMKNIVPIEEEDSHALLSPMSRGGSSIARHSRMRSNTHNAVAQKQGKEASKAGTSIKTVNKEVNGVIREEESTPKRKKKSSKSKSKSKSPKSPNNKNSENLSSAQQVAGSGTPKGGKKKKANGIVKQPSESQDEIGADVKHEGGAEEFEGGDDKNKDKPPKIAIQNEDGDENFSDNEDDLAEMEFEKMLDDNKDAHLKKMNKNYRGTFYIIDQDDEESKAQENDKMSDHNPVLSDACFQFNNGVEQDVDQDLEDLVSGNVAPQLYDPLTEVVSNLIESLELKIKNKLKSK